MMMSYIRKGMSKLLMPVAIVAGLSVSGCGESKETTYAMSLYDRLVGPHGLADINGDSVLNIHERRTLIAHLGYTVLLDDSFSIPGREAFLTTIRHSWDKVEEISRMERAVSAYERQVRLGN